MASSFEGSEGGRGGLGTEKAPLVSDVIHLSRSLSMNMMSREDTAFYKSKKTLGWLGGVFAGVALGQLPILFQRVGESL